MTRPTFPGPCPACVEQDEAQARVFANAHERRPLGLYTSREALERHMFIVHSQATRERYGVAR